MSTRPLLRALLACTVLAAAISAQTSIDAIHYKLELEILFNSKTIAGTQTASFKSLKQGLKTLELDLHSNLKVLKVSDDKLNPLSFTRPKDKILISLGKAMALNEQFTVVVKYAGKPGRSSSFGGFSFSSHRGYPLAWTLSEPWDAKLWWPGKDQLGDKATFEMHIIHPDTMSAASNGKLMGIDKLPGKRLRTRWSTSYPMIPYLASLAVTNYKRRTDYYKHMGANMPVEFFVFPESFNSWKRGMDAIVPMLTAFSNAFGQYPFVKEKYGLAQFNWGGGMEHQTISSQYSASEWLSAHELGHQWWGDAITCATWHDIWLNEGFATFCEALWQERKPGGSMAAYHSYMRRRKPYRVDGTVYVYRPTSVSQIFSSTNVYRKGGWAVHMLRHVLGEKLFWQALRDYRKTYEGKSATTAQFQKSVEKSAGRDMGWFFDQWIMKNGAPTYNYAWKSYSRGTQHGLLLELDQSQSYRNYFEMPVDVRVTTSGGTETHRVWNDARQDRFFLPLKGPATAVTIDPDQWILRPRTRTKSFTLPFWGGSTKSMAAQNGGMLQLQQDHGAAFANRFYLVLTGMSGSKPGLQAGSLNIPVNFDAMSKLGLAALNTPIFHSFFGKLDALGRGSSRFQIPAALASNFKGRTLVFSSVLIDKFDRATPAWPLKLR